MFSPSRKFHSLLVTPALLPLLIMLVTPKAAENHPPTAVDDSYVVHGNLVVPGPGITANDTDPDNDILHIGSCGTVAHGTLNCNTQYSSFTYEPNYGYVGADSFTYDTCDGYGLCDTGTVTLDVRNNAPDAVDDNYTVHGHLFVPGSYALRENDTDADGDPFSVVSNTAASHGTFSYSYQYGALTYDPNYGYTGSDSITYQICDNLGLCDGATATFNVVNNPPVANTDEYTIKVNQTLNVFGPDALRENDSDPDHDPFSVVSYTQTSHGTVTYSYSYGALSYQPNQDFVGQDSFTYTICDNLGACATGNGTIRVIGDGVDDGPCEDCKGAVGSPINITNGNMYLQQADYALPGMGSGINVTRTYNSNSQRAGVFGRGWSTMYDESIQIYSATFIRYNAAGGRATYFARPNAGAAFTPIERDFHGQIVQNGSGRFTLTMNDGSAFQ